jgi:tol-pal system protein YbgF
MICRVLPRVVLALLFAVGVGTPAFAQQQPATPGTGANYETRLSALEDQMRALNGQVEQLDFAVRRIDQSLQRLQSDMDARLSRVEATQATQAQAAQVAAPPPPVAQTPPPAPQQPAATETPVNGTLGAIKMQDGKVTGGVNNPQAPPLPNAPADYGLTPQEQYDRAFALLRQANYEEAEKAFKSFIDKNPKDKLIDNAKYWYGETLYVSGHFDESAVAFADAYSQNPQGNKAPDSLLKLAMSLGAIDKTADACTTLTELKKKFPNASSTIRSRADEQRVKLKCGAP